MQITARPRCRILLLVLLLVTLFAGQAVFSMRQKSVTTDEIMYIAAGYYHLRTGRFDLNTTNPPLMKMLAAVPLLLVQPELPKLDSDPAAWNEIKQWQYSREFLYENSVDADTILFLARLPIVLLGVVLGIYLFVWSRQVYGERAALFALLLYTFSPNILAHTRLATQDLGLAAFMFITAYYFWRYVNRPSIPRLLACGVALSAAVLTKTTAMFMIPIALIYSSILVIRKDKLGISQYVVRTLRIPAGWPRSQQAVSLGIAFLVIGMILVSMLNLGYLFDGSFRPASAYISQESAYEHVSVDSETAKKVVDTILEAPVPFPEPFVALIKFQQGRVSRGNQIHFSGQTSRSGWWYVMPAAFLIKTPIPLLILVAVALYLLVRTRQLGSTEWLGISVISVLFLLFSYLKGISIGLRYLLPVYPFLHLLASRLVRDRVTLKLSAKISLVALLTWYVLGTLHIYPHYLAYFNELVGGPKNGHYYLVDSFLDWGQDLKGLKKYMDEQGIERIRLGYFGSADANYYGINYDYLPSVGLAPREDGEKWWFEMNREEREGLPRLDLSNGAIAVSATLLAGVFFPGYYSELRKLEPIEQVGYSILIYDLNKNMETRLEE